ncbi:helix-turn-helix domain-containing protein [Corynebacterium striatum]
MTISIQGAGAVPEFELKHRVKLAREYAGLSQGELAELTGLSRGGIAKIESGESETRRSSITLIAFATGVNRQWLENGETPTGDEPGGGEEVRHQGLEPRTH